MFDTFDTVLGRYPDGCLENGMTPDFTFGPSGFTTPPWGPVIVEHRFIGARAIVHRRVGR